jgi:hypothetical protein
VVGETRLYLAESVAAVIEVKSTLPAQLSEAQRTLSQLLPLRRSYGAAVSFGPGPSETIPLFVATYTGWKTVETVKEHVSKNPGLSGVLVIDQGICAFEYEVLE